MKEASTAETGGGLCPISGPHSQLQWHPFPRSPILLRTFPASLKSRQIGSLQGQPRETTEKPLTPDCIQEMDEWGDGRRNGLSPWYSKAAWCLPTKHTCSMGFFKHLDPTDHSRTEDQTKADRFHDREIQSFWLPGLPQGWGSWQEPLETGRAEKLRLRQRGDGE